MNIEALRAKLLRILEVYVYATVPIVLFFAWQSGTS